MSLKPTSLVVSPKVMADVNASQSMAFKVPPDAVQKGIGDDATYSWIEQFVVADSDVNFDTKVKERVVFQLKLKVPDDSAFPTNAGRTFTQWYRVNPEALANGEGHKDYKMSTINLGRLKMLARACEFEIPEGVAVDMLPYFAPEGDTKAPVVGYRLFARITDKPGEDQDGNKIRRQEPTKFVSEAEGGSL